MACTIGQQLKQARLAKGLSIEDVSHATKICVSALEAMEVDDLSIFPNGTYRRGFLSLYSRYLGVDASEVLATMSQKKGGRRSRPDFLQTDLELTPGDQTIPIVKHRIIERKPRRSPIGLVLFLLLAVMLPAVYYAGKWVGLRERVMKEKAVEVSQSSPSAPLPKTGETVRARVITPGPKDRYSDTPVRVYPPDPQMNDLLGLDAEGSSKKKP